MGPGDQSTTSGIQTTSSGDRHIPQSVRADGSVRKEIKVRPGYRPPEDVEVYRNRTAEAWKTRGSGGVPGTDGLKEAQGPADSKKGKNARRREARKKAKETECTAEPQGASGHAYTDRSQLISNGSEKGHATYGNLQSDHVDGRTPISADDTRLKPDVELEKEKQARNLKKKLRQARELKEKNESGEALLPEQFAKVIKIQELIRQLESLGFDSDGAQKPLDAR